MRQKGGKTDPVSSIKCFLGVWIIPSYKEKEPSGLVEDSHLSITYLSFPLHFELVRGFCG